MKPLKAGKIKDVFDPMVRKSRRQATLLWRLHLQYVKLRFQRPQFLKEVLKGLLALLVGVLLFLLVISYSSSMKRELAKTMEPPLSSYGQVI